MTILPWRRGPLLPLAALLLSLTACTSSNKQPTPQPSPPSRVLRLPTSLPSLSLGSATPGGSVTASPTGAASASPSASSTATAPASSTGAATSAAASAARAVSASPVAGATSTPAAFSSSGVYTVKAGDTLVKIATQLGIPLAALAAANSEVNLENLHPGQELRLPSPNAATPSATTSPAAAGATAASGSGRTYTVQPGDTACKLATVSKISLKELAAANGTSADALTQLKPGQELQLPAATGSPPGC